MTLYGLLTPENKKMVKQKYEVYKLKQTCDNVIRVAALDEEPHIASQAENRQALNEIVEEIHQLQEIEEKSK